ncbi:MAG: hypothetical protein QHH15_02090 [Candidatus Thermoplasmatota archaeon]|jgi:hypothetical protein|nr:hypothetical protein [Candidatus Thermoplasmatota archaeon]
MNKYNKLIHNIILISFLSIFIINIFNIATVIGSPEKTMIIVTEEEIYEEKNFSVSVLDPDLLNNSDIQTPYLSDVQIEFNNIIYYIDEDLEVTIKAPSVTEDKIFTIKASKQGYVTAYKNITVINYYSYKLEIIHNNYVVDGGKKFSVQVVDENGYIVPGAEVYIQNYDEPSSITNEKGFATLKAPEKKENFILIAKKEGYDYAKQIFYVNIQPSLWEILIKNSFFPIFMGAILLISAIIFVNLRQKKSINAKSKEISAQKTNKKYDLNPEVKIISNENEQPIENQYYSKDVVRAKQTQDAKVEEIRISKSSKEKRIIPIKEIEEETDKIISRRKLQKYEDKWFEGIDEFRYEIEKITGEIDENTVDKWFEGYDDIKNKINEKIKKKDKSKK